MIDINSSCAFTTKLWFFRIVVSLVISISALQAITLVSALRIRVGQDRDLFRREAKIVKPPLTLRWRNDSGARGDTCPR